VLRDRSTSPKVRRPTSTTRQCDVAPGGVLPILWSDLSSVPLDRSQVRLECLSMARMDILCGSAGTWRSMPTTIPQSSAEPLQDTASAVVHVLGPSLELPHIVPDPSVQCLSQLAARLRIALSLGISFLGHAGLLFWLGYSQSAFVHCKPPVRDGYAAINLTAVMASSDGRTTTEESPEWPEVGVPEDRQEQASDPPIPVAMVEPVKAPEPQVRPALSPLGPEVAQAVLKRGEVCRASCSETVPEDVLREHDAVTRVARTHVDRQPTMETTADVLPQPSSAASAPSAASRASEGAHSAPAPVYNPAPKYPPEALKARRTGRVVVHVEIAGDGSVLAARIYRSSGTRSLDFAALEAVRRWRFQPAPSLSAPVRHAAVPVRFVIPEDAAGRE